MHLHRRVPRHPLPPHSHILRIVLRRALHLSSQLLQRLPLRLRDQQRREDTAEHEERKDLQDMVQPRRRRASGRCATGSQGADEGLGEDGADFARGGGDAVGGGAVSGREAFAWYYEGCCVWTEVEEELGDDVEAEEGASAEVVVGEAHDAEDDGEDDEAADLDGLATDGVDEGYGYPVSRYGAGADDDQVPDGCVV